MRFHWFLPTTGDGAEVRAAIMTTDSGRSARRPGSVRYLSQVARAAEDAGFEAALTPVGAGCPDPWIVCTAVAQHTERIKMLVAFRPGFALPTLLAQQVRAFQEVSDGRLMLNVVTGGDPVEQRAYGDFLDHDARYARTDEFLEVLRRSFEGVPFDHVGAHYRIEGGGLDAPLAQVPPLYFGGSSPAAVQVAAKHVDVALTWGEPPAAVARKVSALKEAAAARGRDLRVGLRVHVISRDTSAEAWGEADKLLAGMDPARIEAAQRRFARFDSTAQRAMTELHGGDTRDLEISPGLWAGVGLVREGAGTALVGSHDEVAALLREYASVGIEEFILSGWPHLEEAYRIGENVLPRLAPALV
ncbi:LLM class flavin-dependent oxidoreductase [Actinocorallia sp. A-T 12471]|uniref:LLM class flavin-dependent oxidoreductase n=1 Tax=Actinocorallia sp. A-T 12471 TaxID=3089813 RepID=UPI0029CE45BA|nr:LLM class flavin-dependent oxidoreductase [Actinocorallia sp. A-T 12471]MDX6740271.1 LLM class flavin-dependent oxidoreductase [Actinocorallia sp. A-T 12471]